MHVWTLLQHMMIVFFLRTWKNYCTQRVRNSCSVLFVIKFLTLFTCDNASEKDTRVNENEHTCDPRL